LKTITVKVETIDDIVDFKPNSALSASTNVFFGILEEGAGDQY
jgi:hypothetical protein